VTVSQLARQTHSLGAVVIEMLGPSAHESSIACMQRMFCLRFMLLQHAAWDRAFEERTRVGATHSLAKRNMYVSCREH